MFRSVANLDLPFPASAAAVAGAAGVPATPRPARVLGPGPVPVLVTCVFVLLFGWILLRGDSDREATRAASEAGVRFCGAASCVSTLSSIVRPLPREWRWEMKTYEFEHMYRD